MPNERPETRLKCALVVRGAFDAHVVPAFEAAGGRAAIHWAPTTVIMKTLAEGETADAVLVLSDAMDRLVAEGRVEPESRVDIVRSRYGIAVKAGAPHPDIANVEALKRTLVAARSVAYSRTGASGIYFAGLLPRLGLAEAVNARATIIPQGFTAEKLVSGEADIAVQQISELMVVPGIEVVGPLPDPVQEMTTFAAAILRGATDRDGAARFLAGLTTPQAAEAYRTSGLEPAY
ncbi:substrate-binding domain-containing protein [Methylobacterium oryzae CBMB20]|uniref:Molybdate ABC transporter substrate-binding protein n=1 Tax=Methylobacterium oryzae TaxID=334852 RepID=A0ABU7TQ00_9HYPH